LGVKRRGLHLVHWRRLLLAPRAAVIAHVRVHGRSIATTVVVLGEWLVRRGLESSTVIATRGRYIRRGLVIRRRVVGRRC
jgi:hypothetical protein